MSIERTYSRCWLKSVFFSDTTFDENDLEHAYGCVVVIETTANRSNPVMGRFSLTVKNGH